MTKADKKKSAAKKSIAKKVPARTGAKTTAVKTPTKHRAVTSDDQKRLARNEALRAWRKANREKVNAYMKAWHAKKGAQVQDGTKKEADPKRNEPSTVGREQPT